MKCKIVITCGSGFIGSHVVRLFVNKYPEYHIINLDKLTHPKGIELSFTTTASSVEHHLLK